MKKDYFLVIIRGRCVILDSVDVTIIEAAVYGGIAAAGFILLGVAIGLCCSCICCRSRQQNLRQRRSIVHPTEPAQASSGKTIHTYTQNRAGSAGSREIILSGDNREIGHD